MVFFTYRSTRDLQPGTRVIVNFGKKKKQLAFIVQQIAKEDCPEGIEIKAVDHVIDDQPLIDMDYLNLMIWTSDFYLSAPGKVFDLMFKTLGTVPVNRNKQNEEDKASTQKKTQSLTKTGLKK